MKIIELRDTSCEGDEIYARNQLNAIIDIFCIVNSDGTNVWGMDTQLFENREKARQKIIDVLMNVVWHEKKEV